MPASILERTSSARRGFLRTKSPTGRPMTSSIHVDVPSGRRRSSSHASALARCDILLPPHVQRFTCEWSRCNKYLQVSVARRVVALQDHCARVIQHQLRLVELDWIGIVARDSEHCGGIRTGLPITLHFGMRPRRRFARTLQTVVLDATCDEGRTIVRREEGLYECRLARSCRPGDVNECSLDHIPNSRPSTLLTNPPGPSAEMICRIPARTSATLPFCSAAVIVLE